MMSKFIREVMFPLPAWKEIKENDKNVVLMDSGDAEKMHRIVAYSYFEGDAWNSLPLIAIISESRLAMMGVHALLREDGRVWDKVNKWRPEA